MTIMGIKRELNKIERKVWEMYNTEFLSVSQIDKELGLEPGRAREIIVGFWKEDKAAKKTV